MATLNMPHTSRGVAPMVTGRMYTCSSPVDCWINISTVAGGDVVAGNARYAFLPAGKSVIHQVPTTASPVFISGITTDPNGDTSPTVLTITDSGACAVSASVGGITP